MIGNVLSGLMSPNLTVFSQTESNTAGVDPENVYKDTT